MSVGAELPAEIVEQLQGGKTVVIATVDTSGVPMTTVMSWVVARDPRRVAIAIDKRGRAIENVRATEWVAMEILVDHLPAGCRGRAKVVREEMKSTPFPCAIVELTVEEYRDHSVGGLDFHGPWYEYLEDKKHRVDVEFEIFDELRTY